MGNIMGLSLPRLSWTYESSPDPEGEPEEDVVEMETWAIPVEAMQEECAVNTSLSPRELRRRRRLQI
jgi:hypothetical protein